MSKFIVTLIAFILSAQVLAAHTGKSEVREIRVNKTFAIIFMQDPGEISSLGCSNSSSLYLDLTQDWGPRMLDTLVAARASNGILSIFSTGCQNHMPKVDRVDF